MFRPLIYCALLLVTSIASAQPLPTEMLNDIRDDRAGAYALTGATVHVSPGNVRDGATVLIKDGLVERVVDGVQVPNGYIAVDVAGKHIYASFIDLYSGYGLPEPAKPAPFNWGAAETLSSQTSGAYNTNQSIRSEHRAAQAFTANAEKAKALRDMGFGAVVTHMQDGIARGTGALVLTGDASDNRSVLAPEVATFYSLSKGSSPQAYPFSTMGSIALLRQTFLDADWYAAQDNPGFLDQSLQAWNETSSLPKVMAAESWLNILRTDKVADEFESPFIMLSGGDDYQRIDAVKATGASLIVPLDFPEAKDVSDPFYAEQVGMDELMHWELAPTNPAAVANAGIPMAFTAHDAAKTFWANLRKAIAMGLSEDDALAALTTTPAQMLGVADQIGTLQSGRIANLLITSDAIFAKDSVIHEHWLAGARHIVKTAATDLAGDYQLTISDAEPFTISISGSPEKPALKRKSGDEEHTGSISAEDDFISLSVPTSDGENMIRLSGWKGADGWSGRGQNARGEWVEWSLASVPSESEADAEAEADSKEGADDPLPEGQIIYPFTAYGWESKPKPENFVIRNATVWTLDEQGKIENADVIVRNGKIASVGRDLSASNLLEIDGSGLHVTPGIVDEHSHIALSSVNDVATNSGMVRMNDVINSEDVNIYRNLAGGVTAAQLLHGSANPIGGQSALVKFRWGALPEDMRIKGADGFIKFALGENVKRARTGQSIRFPGTRMGVEQVYRDAFTSAEQYRQAWQQWEDMSRRARKNASPPRRDLALDAMVEILEAERFITCHSYRQSEINMLMHVADDFDFRVNTFTHILEGYKVADKMAEHGVGASTFADWWAYKWEVRYAIPYNPALMTQAGVTVAVNSDSSEMSRRLNQEAAKSIKYGDMSEVEALKLVTLNPAKLLHLDDRMGSVEAGKDADLVLWTAHPLSIEAKVQSTWVDGIRYFDRSKDMQMRAKMAQERNRLIEKMAKSGAKGGGSPGGPKPVFHCDSLHGYEHYDFSQLGEQS